MLEESRTLGTLGAAPIEVVIHHSLSFAHAIDGVNGDVLDLGTGAGVPGLVVAAARPDLHLVLVDRRQSRVDALIRGVRKLGWGDRVDVRCADAARLVETSEHRGQYEAVLSRGFGPPEETLRIAALAAASGGWVVISEPPEEAGSRWDPALLLRAGGNDRQISPPERRGAVAVFHVEHRVR